MIIVCQHCRVASKKKERKTTDFKLFVYSGGWQQFWRHQMAQIKYACYAYIKLIGLIGTIRNGRGPMWPESRLRLLVDRSIVHFSIVLMSLFKLTFHI